MKSNLNRIFESPCKTVFKGKRVPQDFKIVEVNEEKGVVKIQFVNTGAVLPLGFWRFDKTVEVLSKGEWVRLGTRLYADEPSTIEWTLQEHTKKIYGRKADTKTAPHICDILVVFGIAKYGYVENPISKRKNQAVKKI